jgi:hypothetical protein
LREKLTVSQEEIPCQSFGSLGHFRYIIWDLVGPGSLCLLARRLVVASKVFEAGILGKRWYRSKYHKKNILYSRFQMFKGRETLLHVDDE